MSGAVTPAPSPPLQRPVASWWARATSPAVGAVTLVAAEAAIARGHVLAGQIADAVVVFALLNAALAREGRTRAPDALAEAAALRALAVVALVRVIGPGLPIHHWSAGATELLVATLIGFTALALLSLSGLPARRLLAGARPRPQLAALGGGAALGLAAYALGAPVLWRAGDGSVHVAVALAGVTAAAAVEELLFRGLVQLTLQRTVGRAGGAAIASALFAATYFDSGSAALILLWALAGLLFAHAVARTGALGGAIGGHVALAVGAGALWPMLLGRDHNSWAGAPAVVALAAAVAVAAALLGRLWAVPDP